MAFQLICNLYEKINNRRIYNKSKIGSWFICLKLDLFKIMTYSEIKNICKRGKIGLIPGWTGYLKYNYAKNELEFVNNGYTMS